jgi:hypothetical protein
MIVVTSSTQRREPPLHRRLVSRLGNPLAIYGATRGGFGVTLRTAATL